MNSEASSLDLPSTPQVERFQAFFEVLLLSGLASSFLTGFLFAIISSKNAALIAADATGMAAFLLVESGITFLLLAAILRARGEETRSLRLLREGWLPNALLGFLLAVLLLFVVNMAVALLFQRYLPAYYLETNPLTEIIRTPRQLVLFIIVAIVAGGIKEELQRAFILNRFSRCLGGAGVGLVIWSLAFGAGHYMQGLQGIVVTTILGFVFGAVYLMRGSLVAPIVAHSVYNTLALLMYWYSSDGRS